jgi:hypothetical protein
MINFGPVPVLPWPPKHHPDRLQLEDLSELSDPWLGHSGAPTPSVGVFTPQPPALCSANHALGDSLPHQPDCHAHQHL